MRIGIDIADVDEIGRLAGRPRFEQLVFSPAERERTRALGGRRRDEHLAGRFAAKEAVAKLLGTGFVRELMWHDIEVLADDHARPRIHLHRRAATIATADGLGELAVSISHKGPWAIAVAATARG